MTAGETTTADYGERVAWAPARPRIHPVRLLVAWLLSTAALVVAAWIVPGASTNNFAGALAAMLVPEVLGTTLELLPVD